MLEPHVPDCFNHWFHLLLHCIVNNTDRMQNPPTQNEDMRIVCSKAEDFIRRLQRNDLLPSYGINFLSRLAVVERSRDRLRPMVNIEMPRAVRNGDEGEIRCTRTELSLLLRCLHIAECIESSHVLPDDWRGIFGIGDFRLPDKSIDIVSQAHGWWFIGCEQRVEQPLITACVHLKTHT